MTAFHDFYGFEIFDFLGFVGDFSFMLVALCNSLSCCCFDPLMWGWLKVPFFIEKALGAVIMYNIL